MTLSDLKFNHPQQTFWNAIFIEFLAVKGRTVGLRRRNFSFDSQHNNTLGACSRYKTPLTYRKRMRDDTISFPHPPVGGVAWRSGVA